MNNNNYKPQAPLNYTSISEVINYCQELYEYLLIKEVSLNRRLRGLITLPEDVHLKLEVIKPTTSFLKLIENGTDDDMHVNSYWVTNCQDFIEVNFSKNGSWNNSVRIIYSLASGINSCGYDECYSIIGVEQTGVINDIIDVEVLTELKEYGKTCYDFRCSFWRFIENERSKYISSNKKNVCLIPTYIGKKLSK
jgi:hypothetical protein